ncbi:MAG: glycosyltransferase, partial [Pseudomonadota bacterium]
MSNWCVFQIGAREHYAVPRAISAVGEQYHLYTDYWAREASLGPKNLRQRTHPKIPDDRVTGFNRRLMAFEAISRLRRRSTWEQIEARNTWFQNQATGVFLSELEQFDSPPVVFAYSYAALGILRVAQAAGCRTLLAQIDPGPAEFRLVDKLHKRAGHPILERPSSAYWDSWHNECAVA